MAEWSVRQTEEAAWPRGQCVGLRRQRGRVVSASDLLSGGPGFESRSGHLLDLCSVVPSLNSRPRL